MSCHVAELVNPKPKRRRFGAIISRRKWGVSFQESSNGGSSSYGGSSNGAIAAAANIAAAGCSDGNLGPDFSDAHGALALGIM